MTKRILAIGGVLVLLGAVAAAWRWNDVRPWLSARLPWLASRPAFSEPSSNADATTQPARFSGVAGCRIEDGLFVKALCRYDVPVFDESLTRKTGEAHQYWIYYDFDAPEAIDQRGFYKLGVTPSTDSVIGYARKAFFVPWSTTQVLVPATLYDLQRGGGFHLGVLDGYGTLEDLKARRNPVARLRLSNEQKFSGHPVIAYLSEGSEEYYQIPVLTSNPELAAAAALASAPPVGTQPTGLTDEQIIDKLRVIQIVIVIDTTHSMDPFIAELKTRVTELVDAIANLPHKPLVLIGLWGYRDRVRGIGYPFEHPVHNYLGDGKLISDLHEFKTKIQALDLAPISSEDFPECVFDGIIAAIEGTEWDPAAEHLIVVVGDNENHAPDHPKNPRHLTESSVTEAAAKRGIRISCLYVQRSETVKTQFERLAAENRGLAKVSSLQGELLAWIQANLARRDEWIGKKIDAAKSAGSTTRPQGFTEEEFVEVWEDLRRNLSAAEIAQLSQSERERHLERQSHRLNFELVWVSRRSPGGAEVLKEAELITWSGLKVLEYNLQKVRDVLARDHDWIVGFFKQRRTVATGETDDWLQADTGKPLDEFLIARRVTIPKGMLSLTQDQILAMSQGERNEKKRLLDAVRERLDLFHSVSNFRDFGGIRYGFLPMSVWDEPPRSGS